MHASTRHGGAEAWQNLFLLPFLSSHFAVEIVSEVGGWVGGAQRTPLALICMAYIATDVIVISVNPSTSYE